MCQLMTKFYLLLMGTSDLLWAYTDLRCGFTFFLVAEAGIVRFSSTPIALAVSNVIY